MSFSFAYTDLSRAAGGPTRLLPPAARSAGHTNSVLSVRFTQDGKTLVSSSRDDTIKIWDVATGKLKRTLTNHNADVYGIAFSNDGKLMASGGMDTKIILWDATTFDPLRTLNGHTGPGARAGVFPPMTRRSPAVRKTTPSASGMSATGDLKVTRTEHEKKIKAVFYSSDGQTIVTASQDTTIRFWTAAGEPKQILHGHKSGLESCRLSPDGKQMLSASDNGQLIFWDFPSGKLLHEIRKAHELEIDSVAYSPDGKWAISGSKDKTEKFWNPKKFELRHTIHGNPGRSESMCFSPDGNTFVTGFGEPILPSGCWTSEISKTSSRRTRRTSTRSK